MQIELTGAGKRFNREWIFRHAHLQFKSGTAYAITGHNGSGKSTLLQSIGGMLQLSEGRITFTQLSGVLPDEKVYQRLSFCAPYLDVIEEMTLVEFLAFHSQFKPIRPALTIAAIIDIIDLGAAAQKQIRFYSSGMKQRVKLAQAILWDTDVILLDEPCSNLDAKGIALYHSLIQDYCSDRIVIVCSNDEVEYRFCQERIEMQQFK